MSMESSINKVSNIRVFFYFPYNYKNRVLACFQTRPGQHYATTHVFLYYTRTDFMPFADSQNKAKIYSLFLYPVYSSLSSIHL